MQDRPHGPSEENLRKLAGMLPTMAEGIINGKIHGPEPKGGKVCVACTKIFGRVRKDNFKIRDVCPDCRKILEPGGVIFICDDNRMLAVKPKSNSAKIADAWSGRVVKVQNATMDKLYQEFTPIDKPPKGGQNQE